MNTEPSKRVGCRTDVYRDLSPVPCEYATYRIIRHQMYPRTLNVASMPEPVFFFFNNLCIVKLNNAINIKRKENANFLGDNNKHRYMNLSCVAYVSDFRAVVFFFFWLSHYSFKSVFITSDIKPIHLLRRAYLNFVRDCAFLFTKPMNCGAATRN